MSIIKTSDPLTSWPFLSKITIPTSSSHKGQNGKVLVIGGSSLFHGAVLWAAEAASAIVDMVHVASTKENNEIIRAIKTMWQTGMVISEKDIDSYAQEDDVILIGNGMMRTGQEGEYAQKLVSDLIARFPDKQFVFDAGALQVMSAHLLTSLRKKAVLTPHQREFQTLFGVDISALSLEEKERVVQDTAHSYSCIIVLKAVSDIISNGSKTVVIQGGNAGLTKGGTGDILAGLTAGMSATSDPFVAAIIASYLLKKTADELFEVKGFWYTTQDILALFPSVFHRAFVSTSV